MNQRALIIEDRPEIAILYGRSLDALEFQISYASNLRDAYEILSQQPPPDLVFLDLNLSVAENAEYTVNQISRIKTYNPDMVVVVISGVLTPNLINIALQQGANATKEKMDMNTQVEVWKTIETCFENVPATAKDRLTQPIEILKRLLPFVVLFIGRLGRLP